MILTSLIATNCFASTAHNQWKNTLQSTYNIIDIDIQMYSDRGSCHASIDLTKYEIPGEIIMKHYEDRGYYTYGAPNDFTIDWCDK